ncbi:MAG: methyltransferase domain-containing protein [Pirellulales bacterium]
MAGSLADTPIPGGWTERSVTVAGRVWQLLLPADPDEFLQELPEPDTTAPLFRAQPYWAQLWSAALPLAELVARRSRPAAFPVLELGCGIGLAGLVACGQGDAVTFSDLVPEAVELALENARRNGCAERATGRVIDWCQPPAERFPWIIASDVLYDPALHAPLTRAIEQLLEPAGEAWIADPGRCSIPDFALRWHRPGWSAGWYDELSQPLVQPTAGRFRWLRIRAASEPA